MRKMRARWTDSRLLLAVRGHAHGPRVSLCLRQKPPGAEAAPSSRAGEVGGAHRGITLRSCAQRLLTALDLTRHDFCP